MVDLRREYACWLREGEERNQERVEKVLKQVRQVGILVDGDVLAVREGVVREFGMLVGGMAPRLEGVSVCVGPLEGRGAFWYVGQNLAGVSDCRADQKEMTRQGESEWGPVGEWVFKEVDGGMESFGIELCAEALEADPTCARRLSPRLRTF